MSRGRLSARGIDTTTERFLPKPKGPDEHPRYEAPSITEEIMRKHNFSHTVIEHHEDGSHTIHHIHKKHGHVHDVPKRDGDVKGAAADHDSMLDHVMDHTSQPNPGEAAAEAGDHGIPAEHAGPAGIAVPPAAGAAAPAAGAATPAMGA